jgi:ParB-like chromosome segregation protein Spo0J
MTDFDFNDDDSEPIPTRKGARREQKKLIKRLEKGDEEEQRKAAKIKQCRKGMRCGQGVCPCCQRLMRRTVKRIQDVISYGWSSDDDPWLVVQVIFVNDIQVRGDRRPLNEEKVTACMASMDLIGLRTPITVRTEKKKVFLVVGRCRLEAAKRLGWKEISCFVIPDEEKAHARLWELSEDLYRADLVRLDRAERINELRVFINNPQVGQLAPPGGDQPKSMSINRTARALGLTKEEVRRSKSIAELPGQVRAAARAHNLDDNQDALIRLTKLPTPEAQLKAVKEIAERKVAERKSRANAAAASDKKAAAKIDAIKAEIEDKSNEVEQSREGLEVARMKLSKLENKLAEACADETLSDRMVESPPIAAVDSLDRSRPIDKQRLSTDDQAAFENLMAAWEAANSTVRERFLATVWDTSRE